LSDTSSNNDFPELKEGRDYIIENGNYVFTRYYLKKRGYCCGSGCRNCPYQMNVVSEQASVWEQIKSIFGK